MLSQDTALRWAAPQPQGEGQQGIAVQVGVEQSYMRYMIKDETVHMSVHQRTCVSVSVCILHKS